MYELSGPPQLFSRRDVCVYVCTTCTPAVFGLLLGCGLSCGLAGLHEAMPREETVKLMWVCTSLGIDFLQRCHTEGDFIFEDTCEGILAKQIYEDRMF